MIIFRIAFLLLIIFTAQLLMAQSSNIITGTLIDANDQTVISRVTVQLFPSGKTTLTNEDGQFRILKKTEDNLIKFSHVAYQSVEFEFAQRIDLGVISMSQALHIIRGQTVYERSYDRAQAIIIKAIKRNEENLARINNYKNDSYLKFVIRDVSKEDSTKIFLITETQTTVYWQYPDQYKEILTARKSTANINSENIIMGIGEMLNFSKSRFELGEYQIVSPTAKDALDYYNYYLLDTIRVDNSFRYLLEVEPKNQSDPLFAGTIQIVASTFDVVMVDVGFNKGAQLPLVTDLRYQQKMVLFDSTYWVPTEISFEGSAEIKFPGLPSKMNFEFLASLYSFEFDQVFPDDIFDEFEFEVTETADDIDSAAWLERQTVVLSTEELVGYARIDSLEQLPKPLGKKILMGLGMTSALMLGAVEDLFHFNRVEGPYFGIGGSSRKLIKNTRLWGGAGYSDELTDWQYHLGFKTRVTKQFKLNITAEIKDKITKQPSVTTKNNYNSSGLALLARLDPFDYYREQGFKVGFDFQPLRHNRLSFSLNSYDHSSVTVNNDYSIFNKDSLIRINPEISEGQLRSLKASWQFDSRQKIKNKGIESQGFAKNYLTFELSAEHSSPEILSSDFHFQNFSFKSHLQGRFIGNGKTEINLTLGYSKHDLPPQRFYGLDLGNGVLLSESGFITLGDSLFFGDRVASAFLIHDFGRKSFTRLPIPLINKLPFGLMIHGGAFWSSFESDTFIPEGNDRVAIKPYTEAGFTITNLTPFLAPFNFAAGVTWQLSAYDTSHWEMHFGVKL